MNNTIRHYSDDKIDISFEARRCIHAAECVRRLPSVFDTARRPWVLPQAADVDSITTVIRNCPAGALHYTRRDGGEPETLSDRPVITPRPNGPLYVRGHVQLRAANGSEIIQDTRMALCRCGHSQNKPFCDNGHRTSGFKDSGAVADGGELPEAETSDVLSITASANGPLVVEGQFVVRSVGSIGQFGDTHAELCRCGASGTKPFCDGTHQEIGFRTEESDGSFAA